MLSNGYRVRSPTNGYRVRIQRIQGHSGYRVRSPISHLKSTYFIFIPHFQTP